MSKSSGWMLAAGLIFGGVGPARGQMQPFGAPMGQMPPEMQAMQKEQQRLMKEAVPEFYEYQERLQDVEAKVRQVKESLAKKEVDMDEAKAELVPLVKERQEIRNDPEFLAWQELAQVCFSSPEFQAKMGKIMRKFAPKPPSPSKAPAPRGSGR